MNKKELIKRIESNTWLKKTYTGETEMFIPLSKLRELLEQLDEPKKVVIPRFVAEWIKQCKKVGTLADCLNGYYETGVNKVVSSEDFQTWFLEKNNEELTAEAWLYGYELEPEPAWVVKFTKHGEWYFTGWGDTSDGLGVLEPDGADSKWYAYKFTDNKKAEALAVLIDGTIEEVHS